MKAVCIKFELKVIARIVDQHMLVLEKILNLTFKNMRT